MKTFDERLRNACSYEKGMTECDALCTEAADRIEVLEEEVEWLTLLHDVVTADEFSLLYHPWGQPKKWCVELRDSDWKLISVPQGETLEACLNHALDAINEEDEPEVEESEDKAEVKRLTAALDEIAGRDCQGSGLYTCRTSVHRESWCAACIAREAQQSTKGEK